ncbi:MAG TPA: hypothetical protein VF533_25655 [Solirubrobacteraceae bacterium]|jgi:hypothetical protein
MTRPPGDAQAPNDPPVAALRWHTLGWQSFLAELETYKERFLDGGVNKQELHYIQCLRAFEGHDSTTRAARARYLVAFLNRWECRLVAQTAEQQLREWIRARTDRLDALQGVSIHDESYLDHLNELVALYDEIMLLRQPRPGLHNWSDACASKTLGQLAPSAFVIWDNAIKGYSARDYWTFLADMHELALRLVAESPADDGPALEAWLQSHLQYVPRKTVAKFLDEYNWHVAVGRGYARRL